uniref:RING-type E3 ubiquitin transferase n=1 Tax=Acrobeloides nanus TaxID=290746 RepID=A0A914EGN6_9BILA
MAYYCHECNRNVTVDNNMECTDCHGGFVEEVPGNGGNVVEEANTGFIASPFQSPIQALLTGLMNQRNPPPSTSTQHPQRTTAEPEDAMRDFMGQLLTNLIGNLGNRAGGAIHIEIGDENGGRVFHGNLGDYAWGEGGLDQVVTMLLNQFDPNSAARGVSKEDLQNLPMAEVTEKQVENGSQCTTCMEEFKPNESVAVLDCQHIFHRPCIDPWLERHNTCPICRQEVDPSKWPKKKKEVVDIDELD